MRTRFSRHWLLIGLAILLVQAPQAFAFRNYLTTWSTISTTYQEQRYDYAESLSDDNANCALCHNDVDSGSGGLNPYGLAIANAPGGDISAQIGAVENLNSDGDPNGCSNLEEIIANTQPGWTGGAPSGVMGAQDPASPCAVPNIAVDPITLDFSTVTVDDSSSLTTTVENTGTADLNVSGIALGGGTSTEFSVSPTAAFTLAPGATETVTVTYMPTNIGDDSGSIVISSDDPDSPTVSVDVSGTGTAAAVPDIALAPSGVDFGPVTIGGTGTQTARILNEGDAPLLITEISLCSGTSTEFSFDPLANLTIPAGGFETLTVKYTPAAEGTDSGCLSIASNDPDEDPIEFTVAGSGTVEATPDIALDPTTLDFGPVTVGESNTLTAEIRNVGSADLEVTDIALAVGTSSEYTLVAPTTPVTIPALGSQTISVTYAPIDVGTDTGAVVVASDDPDEPEVSLGLSGSGNEAPLPPDINLDPAALDFGTVSIGNTESLTTAVQNLGGHPLEVTAIALCMGTSTEFTWSTLAPLPFTVPVGSSVDLTATYAPTDEGLDEGCLAISSDDPDESPVELALSGIGQEPVAELEVMIKVPGAINPENRGVTPVKFYAFDRDVLVDRVRCGRDGEDPERINYEDFNDDGFMDSVALFETEDLEIECGDFTFECSGMLKDGTDFSGTSSEFQTVGRECRRHREDDDDDDDDGVSDEDEYEDGTDPYDRDTDDDGMNDGDERDRGTDPRDKDTDDDGLEDGDERDRGTDPSDSDTDSDGVSDGDEVTVFGTNPLVADNPSVAGSPGSSGGGCTIASRSAIDPTLPGILALLGMMHALRRRVGVKR